MTEKTTPEQPIEPAEDLVGGAGIGRRKVALFAGAAFAIGALAVGGIAAASQPSASNDAVQPAESMVMPGVGPSPVSAPTDTTESGSTADDADIDDMDEIDEMNDGDIDGPVDGEDGDDEMEDGLNDEGHDDDIEISPADEAVFNRFDTCLADAGFDDAAFEQLEQAELDGSLDEAQLDEQWAAVDSAFEQCEPILTELSPELQAELEADEGDHDGLVDCDDEDEGADEDDPDSDELNADNSDADNSVDE
ncbi:MAG: hypothetical protein AAFY28_15895 [Actinomycetota bacterium]